MKLTVIGRATASIALAVCHIDKTALYKIKKKKLKTFKLSMISMSLEAPSWVEESQSILALKKEALAVLT